MDGRIRLEQVFNVPSLIFMWSESLEVLRYINRLLSPEPLVKWR